MIWRRLFAEFLATGLLLATVVGSGIMAERVAGGIDAIALLANTLASIGGLYVLIEVFGPISGAHMNPAVSTVMATRGQLPWMLLPGYIVAQLFGAAFGACGRVPGRGWHDGLYGVVAGRAGGRYAAD